MLIAAPVAVSTQATVPTAREMHFLAAGIGVCEGTFDNDSPEEEEVHRVCGTLVERGWMTREEAGSGVYYATSTEGRRLVAVHRLDQKQVKRIRRAHKPV